MGLPETADFARNFAVMVRVHGPDPKGLKMRKHAFHQYISGKTILSASGMLLPDTLFDSDSAKRILDSNGDEGHGLVLVLTVGSVVESFLSPKQRGSISQGKPEMIPGVEIDVMLEEKLGLERNAKESLDKGGPLWLTAQLIRLVDVPVSSLALQSLVESYSGSVDHGWEVGWSLASYDDGPRTFQTQTGVGNTSFMEGQRPLAIGESADKSFMSKATTRFAILGVFLSLKDLPHIVVSPSNKRGDSLLAVGSPFGVLSPIHFFNSLSMGFIANCYPARSHNFSLLMADIRCLPGMEGGPVFGEHAHFIGILTRPLRQKGSGAEIQLVIPWEAIATACSDLLLKEPQNAEKGIHINKENLNAVGKAYNHESDGPFNYQYEPLRSYCPSPLPVEKVMASVCLITIDEGVWASGVVLNDRGLVLTNAHLLEPWRFGKTSVNGGRNETKSVAPFLLPEESGFHAHSSVDSYQKSQRLPPEAVKIINSSVVDQSKGYQSSFSHRSYGNIRVRLDHVYPWIWCDAKALYVCKGPLDVALLQLDHVPDQLCAIKVDFSCPILGSQAYVVGHGLFGPRCGFSPSVCSGVVAKVVKAKAPPSSHYIIGEDSHIPAMLETTAAVHSGSSGGAVINTKGHMIGLVTSNARHGGGTVIPHLNFSIPCAVMAPIFEFAGDMQDISVLKNLDQQNEHFSSVWALMPPLSPKPSPPLLTMPQSLLEDNESQGKGSKFAKFIVERDKILRSATQLGKVDSIPSEIFPSKL